MSRESNSTDAPRLDPAAVCTLPPDGLTDRMAWIRTEILPLASKRERRREGLAWTFEDTPELAERLERLVALERECCSGIAFRHRAIAGGQRLLEVEGIDPDAAVFGDAAEPASPALPLRIAKATGIGAGVSLLLCCALPIAAGAVFGAAVAAPLATLDDPVIIGVAALGVGGAAFAWDRSRRAAASDRSRPEPGCGPGC
ncbi:MAG: hypothetical protein HKP30_00915 [Myxococcales bacterium]|nr:hypothetical protein [Myxococcales bacterium]